MYVFPNTALVFCDGRNSEYGSLQYASKKSVQIAFLNLGSKSRCLELMMFHPWGRIERR